MIFGAFNRPRSRGRIRTVLLVVTFAVALYPASASAANSAGSEAGVGVGAALCSLVYGPVKISYALLGLVFGGMAWGLSGGDGEVLDAVMTPAVRGDYVVTPSHLRGEKPLQFIGRRPGYGPDSPTIDDEFETTY